MTNNFYLGHKGCEMETDTEEQVKRPRCTPWVSNISYTSEGHFLGKFSLPFHGQNQKRLFVLSTSCIRWHQLWQDFVGYKAQAKGWFFMESHLPSFGVTLIKIFVCKGLALFTSVGGWWELTSSIISRSFRSYFAQ